jgi:transcriptional regulator with XRE-family HTH domain
MIETTSVTTDIRSEVGQRIAARRARLGLTQEDLADAIHHTRIAVALWETGKSAVPMKFLLPLASTLRVKVSWIVGEADEVTTQDERDLLDFYRGMPPELQPTARKMFETMAKEHVQR